MQYVFPFIIESNISKWKQNEMERRRFTQHESTIGHKNQGRKAGQSAVTNFLHIQPVHFSDLSISLWLCVLGGSQRKMLQLINLSLLYLRYLSLMGSYILLF